MKKLFLGLLLISTVSAFSQELNWMTNFSEAAELSKKTNKPILANFTGSDWCHYCKILDKQVFSTNEFKSWAKENVILLELDFPKRKKISPELKKQNYALQNAFGVRGYPTVWLFESGKGDDPKKDIVPLGKSGYLKGGPSKWIKSIDRFMPKS
jgi:protein disulfide-isomerase